MINGYKWECHSINRAAIIDLELVFRSKKCGSLNVPIFHITQPKSVYGQCHGYFFRWCPIFPKWDSYQPLKKCGLRYHRFASRVRKLWRRRFRHSHSILAPLGSPVMLEQRSSKARCGGMALLEQFQQKNNYIQLLYILIEGSLQSNFREYGQMKQQRWEQSEKRKSQKKEDQCARKGRGVVKHCVFPIFCGSGGSK